MELENQVVCQPLAKRIWELGVPQNSVWKWEHSTIGLGWYLTCKAINCPEYYSAFTATELINLLGDNFGVLDRFENGKFGAYKPNDCGINGIGNTPQEALTELLIKTWTPPNET